MDKKLKRYLENLEDPNYRGETNFILSENASALEKSKYKICQSILDYKLKQGFTREQIANKIELSGAETEEILFAKIENFTLDRLVTYASKIFDEFTIVIFKSEEIKLKVHG